MSFAEHLFSVTGFSVGRGCRIVVSLFSVGRGCRIAVSDADKVSPQCRNGMSDSGYQT